VIGIATALGIVPRIFWTPLHYSRVAVFAAMVWTVGVAAGLTTIVLNYTQGGPRSSRALGRAPSSVT
jgi:cytochrome c oxidase cbb3-type subunit 1